MLALELRPEVDDRPGREERADEQRVDERAEALRAGLRRDHRLRDREHRSDRAGQARERHRREEGGGRDGVCPPTHDGDVEAEQQRRREPDRAAGLEPEQPTGDPPDERCGAQRGEGDEREEERAVGGADLEVAEQPQVEPETPAEQREAHREKPERREAERGDLPEPGERVHDREVLLGDRAVVTEHLLDLGATARDVAQPTGRDGEHRRADCEHDERRPPLRGAVEDGGARGDDEGREREAGDADRDVDREHERAGADGERVGQHRALHRNGREDAGTGERDDAEQLPPVERRGAEREREHRDREEPAEHARTVRRRAVGKVPERL